MCKSDRGEWSNQQSGCVVSLTIIGLKYNLHLTRRRCVEDSGFALTGHGGGIWWTYSTKGRESIMKRSVYISNSALSLKWVRPVPEHFVQIWGKIRWSWVTLVSVYYTERKKDIRFINPWVCSSLLVERVVETLTGPYKLCCGATHCCNSHKFKFERRMHILQRYQICHVEFCENVYEEMSHWWNGSARKNTESCINII